MKRILFALLSLAFILQSCSSQDIDSSRDYLEISNDESALSERLEDKDIEIEIDQTTGFQEQRLVSSNKKKPSFKLNLIAEIAPPVVDGKTTQATMVSIHSGSSRAAVSYNDRGLSYAGAVDILQIPSGPAGSIRLRSGVRFTDANTNAVYAQSNRIWAAQSSNNPGLVNDGHHSAIRKFRFNGFNISDDAINHVSLPGFAANSVMEYAGFIYATSGDNAGISVYNSDLSEKIFYTEVSDARWVARDETRIVVLRRSPDQGELLVFDPDTGKLLHTFPFPGADTPEAKNTVELIGSLALIAAGKHGAHVMDLNSGEILVTLPIPDAASIGMAPDAIETNAVSAEKEFIFISNGGAGVYVAEASSNLGHYQSGQKLNVEMVGKLKFDELESVNHVTFRANTLIVAAGLGGVKVVRMERNK